MSGVPPDKIEEIIKHDWRHLVFNKRIFDSPSYLREKGKPVVALWGTITPFAPLYRATANTNRGCPRQALGSKTLAIRPGSFVQSFLT